jgi:hypothetical protein
MSKGPGTVQRRILDVLTQKHAEDPQQWTTVRELITGSDEKQPGRYDSIGESTRRAVRTLAAAGKIETRHEWRKMWVNGVWYPVRQDTKVLVARLPICA